MANNVWLSELYLHGMTIVVHRGAATREMMFRDAPLKHSASSIPLVGIIGTKQTVRYETSFASGRATLYSKCTH